MIGFFIVRRLIELHKVSSKTKGHELTVFSFPIKIKYWRPWNAHDIEKTYDLDGERRDRKGVVYVANQFVHSATSYVMIDSTRNWSDVFITSDRNQKTSLWRIPVEEVRTLFEIAAQDYPHQYDQRYDEEKGVWVTTTD